MLAQAIELAVSEGSAIICMAEKNVLNKKFEVEIE